MNCRSAGLFYIILQLYYVSEGRFAAEIHKIGSVTFNTKLISDVAKIIFIYTWKFVEKFLDG
jgi:hypothetical protein